MATDYLAILRRWWGYDSFRGVQLDIIRSIGEGRDTLGLMPTGGGKSITVQVPAMATEGICLVITPLIALMKDQVDALRRRGIKATAIHTGLTQDEIAKRLDNCLFGDYKFLYVSPERLGSEFFRHKLRKMPVSFITVDEAHCISQWGYDFRPAYLDIAAVRSLLPGCPVLALTATATPTVIDDIQERLGFRRKNAIRMSFARPNLSYVVRHTDNKEATLLRILEAVPGAAIVYTRSRQHTYDTARWLNEQGIKTKRGTTLWRNTSVRAMIGNPIDRGQMHSGDVLSEPFEHLRIIDDYYFYKAVEIIRGRASTKREGPLRTDSGGLLTGMIYCGECGERLTINHCRKVTDTLEGQREYRWSVYRCYRKINSRKTCTGQSTYNAKRIDEAVLSIVRSFFARITTLPEADQMQAAMQRENLILAKAIQTAEDDVEKATKALSALEDEALKTLSGESKLTLDTISKLIEKQKAKQTDARMKLQALLEEKQTDDEKFKAKQEQLQRTKEWAQILDIATPPRKQMILAEIIDRVEVRRGYEITVKFKLTAQQFLDPNGCEAISKIAS